MRNVPIAGSNCTVGEKQPEYKPLVGKREVEMHTRADNGEQFPAMSITCGFELTPEERLAIMNGGVLHVRMLGGWAPVALWIE